MTKAFNKTYFLEMPVLHKTIGGTLFQFKLKNVKDQLVKGHQAFVLLF